MFRVTVGLFFIAILQTGIITFSQANDEETTTKPADVEPDKKSEVPSKVRAEEKSGVSSKPEPKVAKIEEASDVPLKKDNKQTEDKETKANESKKEDVTEKTGDMFLPDVLKGAPIEQTKVLFEFPKNMLRPVTAAGAKIGEAVSKSIDSAKDLADGTFNFLKTSARSLFKK